MSHPESEPATAGVSQQIIERLRPMMTAERVFGPPVVQDGVTIIPAALIRAGGGGGSGGGGDGESSGSGEGGGFGATARPVGAYVVENGTVTWRPAFDANRFVLAALAFAALLVTAVARVRRVQLLSG